MEPQRLSLWRRMAYSSVSYAYTASMEPQRLSLWRHGRPGTLIYPVLLQWSHSAYRCGDAPMMAPSEPVQVLQWSHSAYRCGDR